LKFVSVPNALSLARLPLAAAFVLANTTALRVGIVSAVAVTDLADGYLARRMRGHDRRSGQIVDPITDKLFVLIALIAFAVRKDISVGTLLLLLIRDIYATIGFIVLKVLGWKMELRARLSGKTATVFQIATLLALLFWQAAVRPLIAATVLVSLVAIVDYTQVALRQRRRLAATPAES
jgi:phosphatidylglycerophosphate synthase